MSTPDALRSFQHGLVRDPVGADRRGHRRGRWSWAIALMMCRLDVAAAHRHAVHSHPHEQMMLVERGRVRFIVEGRDASRRRVTSCSFRPAAARRDDARRRRGADRHLLAAREDFLPATASVSRRSTAFPARWQASRWSPAHRAASAPPWPSRSRSAGADIALHSVEHPRIRHRRCHRQSQRPPHGTLSLAISPIHPLPSGSSTHALSAFGRVDILVNNAGIIRRAPAAEHTDDDWDAVIDGEPVERLSSVPGRWPPHDRAQSGGKIINIASMLSFQGGITVPGYAARRAALVQLTKALANEWAASGINVNAIAPGYMETDNTTALRADPLRNRQITERIPAGRWGTPDDLGGAVVFLSSRASDYIHGHVLAVDGGWLAR